jgi:hypothetical protein
MSDMVAHCAARGAVPSCFVLRTLQLLAVYHKLNLPLIPIQLLGRHFATLTNAGILVPFLTLRSVFLCSSLAAIPISHMPLLDAYVVCTSTH